MSFLTTSVLAFEGISDRTIDRLRDELSLITPENPTKSEELILEEEALLSELSDSTKSAPPSGPTREGTTQTEDSISTSLAAPKRIDEAPKEVIEPSKDSKPLKRGSFFKTPRRRSR